MSLTAYGVSITLELAWRVEDGMVGGFFFFGK